MAKTSGNQFSHNFAINGMLDFWQRQEGNTVTVNTASTVTNYQADRVNYNSAGATVKNYSIVRSTDIPTMAQSGFQGIWSYLFSVLTPIASMAATDVVAPWEYRMEGLDYAHLHSKTVTCQFWIKASATGTYSFALRNSAGNRCYVTTFSISAANTWEFKSIAVTLDSSGTWNFDNSIGVIANIGSIGGTNFQTSTLGSWQAGNFSVANTATNYFSATNTVRIAQFGFYLGNGVQVPARNGRSITGELASCQRYYEKSYALGLAPGSVTNSDTDAIVPCRTGAQEWVRTVFKTRKRTSPSLAIYSPVTGAVGQVRNDSAVADQAATVGSQGATGYNLNVNAGDASPLRWHWVSDAEL